MKAQIYRFVVLHVSISSACCAFAHHNCYSVFCLSSLSVPAVSVPATDGQLVVSADSNAVGAIGMYSGCKMARLFYASWPRYRRFESWRRYQEVVGELSEQNQGVFEDHSEQKRVSRLHAPCIPAYTYPPSCNPLNTNSTPTQHPLNTHSTPAQRRIPRTPTCGTARLRIPPPPPRP